jgi:hypothetical protein
MTIKTSRNMHRISKQRKIFDESIIRFQVTLHDLDIINVNHITSN